MPHKDRDILLEALSALTGAEVKHHHEMQPHHENDQHLHHGNFIHTLLTNKVTENESETRLLWKELFVDIQQFFDPRFDYDFRHLKDSSTCTRGNEKYKRPLGWYRFALNVLNKYEDGNAWLGSKGWRSCSVPGEWPVSFHGTSIEGAKGIAVENYRPGPRKRYGRGVYSTPNITFAESYATPFKFKKTGKDYEVIVQNRINPEKRKIPESDYWLIPIPEDKKKDEKNIVNRSIRPYGILIKEK